MNDIKIKFEFYLKSSKEWRSIELQPDEYFDPIEEGNVFEVDSIPRNNDLIDYFFLSTGKDIVKISATIYDMSTEKKITFYQSFWNNQNNWHLERTDHQANKITYRALITVIQLADTPRTTEIIRAIEKDGYLEPEYHGIITNNDDGSQNEKVIFPFEF